MSDPLYDRIAITDVIHRYAHGLDRRDWDMVAACFTADAQATYGGKVLEPGVDNIIGHVRGMGALSCVEFVEDVRSLQPFPAQRKIGKRLESRMREAGLLLRCDPDWIAFAPPFIMTIEQADEMLDIFFKCLRQELGQES